MEEILLGEHELRFEGEELLIIRIRGALLPGQMKRVAEVLDARLLERGRLFVLCDVGRAEPPSYASRQEIKARPKKLPPHWVAYVGIPKEFGTIMDLMLRAASLLSSSKIVHRYFQDEPSARAWLRDMKEKANLSA